jgi:ubiquinone/menaquinone biosynthesis C-methylase UbiE
LSLLVYNIKVLLNILGVGVSSKKKQANSNEATYQKKEVVEEISKRAFLFKPELAVLNKLKSQLPNMKMLDIGIGGGRTTAYFAPLTKEYFGIDYSQEMISICKTKFKNSSPRISFECMDARKMTGFSDDKFDFVLFSFNGLDCVNSQDRSKILWEIHRVTKNKGYFLFSSHNIGALNSLCSPILAGNPFEVASKINRLLLLRFTNNRTWKAVRKDTRKLRYVMFNDGSYHFGLKTLYTDPAEQVKDLKAMGFKVIAVYGMDNIDQSSKILTKSECALHYFCQVTKEIGALSIAT